MNEFFIKNQPVEKIVTYTCGSVTCDNSSNCTSQTPCTRRDLDPCDYDNMGEYSFAVACELTQVIKNRRDCPTPATEPWNSSCSHVEVCFTDLFTPSTVLAYFGSNVSVFKYCSGADCSEYYCDLLGIQTQFHLPLNTTVQDLMADFILAELQNFEQNNTICVSPSNIVFRNIEVLSCYNGAPINCSQSFLCTNMTIRLKVTYTCCNNSGTS